MAEKQKSDGVISLLSMILKGSGEVKSHFAPIVGQVKMLADEVLLLAKAVSSLSKSVHEHSIAIEDLYSLQVQILQQLSKSATDVAVPSAFQSKNKDEKPN